MGGASFSLTVGIIRDELPPARVATSIGLISTTFGIGAGLGLVLAGVMADHLMVAWDFWFTLGLAVVAAGAIRRYLPEPPGAGPGSSRAIAAPASRSWTCA